MEFKVPHTAGQAPNNQGSAGALNVQGVVLIDPSTGNPVIPAGVSHGAGASTGQSLSGSVGVASAVLIPAGTFKQFCVVQNTSANVLHLSFNANAAATDFSLAAGASLSLPAVLANALNGIGSAASTTWAAIGV